MNLEDMYRNSVQFEALCKSITTDTPLSDVLLSSQTSVNEFLSKIGDVLVKEVVADTFMNYSPTLCSDTVHPFAVCAALSEVTTGKVHYYAFPFKLVS